MNHNVCVGLGVLIINTSHQILLGKRIGEHGGGMWDLPGGHLEFGETFEACAKREVFEEIGLQIQTPTFFAITNDFFENVNKPLARHYVTLFMMTPFPDQQEVINCEPHKAECWKWFDIDDMPYDLFLPFKNLLMDQGYGQKLSAILNQTSEP